MNEEISVSSSQKGSNGDSFTGGGTGTYKFAKVGATILSKEESVICHYKDGVLVAITHINGREEKYKIGDPMRRKELNEFYETQSN